MSQNSSYDYRQGCYSCSDDVVRRIALLGCSACCADASETWSVGGSRAPYLVDLDDPTWGIRMDACIIIIVVLSRRSPYLHVGRGRSTSNMVIKSAR